MRVDKFESRHVSQKASVIEGKCHRRQASQKTSVTEGERHSRQASQKASATVSVAKIGLFCCFSLGFMKQSYVKVVEN